jgi:hypothetical protein
LWAALALLCHSKYLGKYGMRVLQHGHRIRVRNNSLAIWRRTWGKVGCGGGPAGARSAHLFSPKPHVLEEAQGDHGQNHVVA